MAECHTVHGRLKATKDRVIQTGDDMPKSLADKTSRYDTCDVFKFADWLRGVHSHYLKLTFK